MNKASVKTKYVDPEKKILLPLEAAAILRISKSEVYRLLATGGLPHVAIGKRKIIRREDLDAWLESKIQTKELA